MIRSQFGETEKLFSIAAFLGFDEIIRYNISDALVMRKQDQGRPKMLASALQAFVGALYLDRGLTIVEEFVSDHFISRVDELIIEKETVDGMHHHATRRLRLLVC